MKVGKYDLCAQYSRCARAVKGRSIVNKVVPKERVIPAAEELAEMIFRSSPLAVQAAVRLYRLSAAFPPALAAYARQLDQDIAETEDGAEGARAFKKKRRPVWKMP